jgi:hypothetical protein
MYTRVIHESECRGIAEGEAMRGHLANRNDFSLLIQEDALIIGPWGVVARLIPNAITQKVNDDAAVSFRDVRGDLSKRGSVIYKGALMEQERADGSLSYTNVVPPTVLELLAIQNARLGLTGPYSDFLGYVDKEPLTPFCRETGWSLERPDIFEISKPLVREVEYAYKEELPHHWKPQREFMSRVSADYKYNDSVFSTGTVNFNVCACYHTDSKDFRGGMGNLVVLKLGQEDSGILVMPRFRIAFRVRPTQVLLMNVHEMHGNMPLTVGGERLTKILYAREHIDECP